MPGCTKAALWFGPGSFLIIAWHIKIPSTCLDAFTIHVSCSNCQPCLSPFSQSPSPLLRAAHCANVAVSPMGDSSNQISDSCCSCPSLASTKPWHFLLSLGKPSPLAHLHILEWQTPRSCQHRQAWSILGTLRTKDWGVCKLVGIAAAGNWSLGKSICLLEESYLGFWGFLNADGFPFPCKHSWDNCRVPARCDGQGTPACNGL